MARLPYLDDFLLFLQTNNLSAETVYNYERDLNVFDNFLTESKFPFSQVSKQVILYYKAYLNSRDRKTAQAKPAQQPLTSYSINRMLSSLRSYLKFLIDNDHPSPIGPNVVKFVKTEKLHPRVGELGQIVNLIESPLRLEHNPVVASRNRALLEVLFSTGLRISELVSLKTEAIDQRGRIFVRGKGKKERFVYLTDRALGAIRAYRRRRGHSPSPYLFIPYRGKNCRAKEKRLSPNYIQERVKRYREILGINLPLSPHSIRHAFATYLAEGGANPVAIQILLGHESLDTTTRYVHASDRYAERTHRKFHPLK